MCFKVKLTVIGLFIANYVRPLASSYNYQNPHPSMNSLAQPGLLPEIDTFLNIYGSMHSMREYIYWTIKEETLFTILRKKLNRSILQRTIIRQLVKHGETSNSMVYTKCAMNLVRNKLSNVASADFDAKQVLKIRQEKMYGLWPDSRDMYLSITGLLMFQRVYLWHPAKVLQDIPVTTKFQASLTSSQTSVIGMCSLYKRMFKFAVEWFEASEKIARRTFDFGNKEINKRFAVDLIVQTRDISIQEHNIMARELGCLIKFECHMYVFTAPIRYTSGDAYLTRKRRLKKTLQKFTKLGRVGLADLQLINLCSGSEQNILPAWKQVNLKCYYEKSHHPYLYIGPVKTEQLSESPLVFQYYEILGPNLIEEMKTHYIENANIPDLVNNVNYYNRNALHERIDPTPGYVINITTKFERHPVFYKTAAMATGFNLNGPAELLQYMDHVPGRGVKVHEDVYRACMRNPEKELDGNRFADLLYYLEVPDMGGYTPFCQAGARANLVKGSMVVWISKFRNGTYRNDTFHGACPVIHGHKMTLAQGVKYTGQENHFKCTLNQFE